MIIDLQRYIATRSAEWQEFERMLEYLRSERRPDWDLEMAQRFHLLFERACADLQKVSSFTGDQATLRYLEELVARGHAEMHQGRKIRVRQTIGHWFRQTFPATVRRHWGCLAMSVALFLLGASFGAVILALGANDETRSVIYGPFTHLHEGPEAFVEEAESAEDRGGGKAAFSTMLMFNNIRVSILVLALGITFGFGSATLLFYNGIILGGVAYEFLAAGEWAFLFGWLLPHGSVEIPAILLAGQGGIMLGKAMLSRRSGPTLGDRMRAIREDLTTIIAGVALLLVWAGIVEAFFSQYHEPVLPYAVKIAFGGTQLVLLFLFLAMAGRQKEVAA